ncbi:ABC transporter ATP-binding protein [Gordonia humi]|uniref:Branched-chain amino acid transport system ATP-binding protein n=1 Tax=Gordonia humi TaxID=686429 RepID=A0A840FCJ6_9ACTN|nr:ABC transporter ATP-binding protein [Gordonia humi]MBB4137217.1 branched-chain amino acid transport system ATP-binding protein [Gordonia humi]
MLEVDKITAGYGKLQILHDLSIRVDAGELVSVVGANGAGKSTMLRAISGLIETRTGEIRYDGEKISGLRPHQVVRRRVIQVSEDRDLFGPMTVEQNLVLGAWTRKRAEVDDDLARVFDLFPILKERRKQIAQTMSGGQQQMVAIGRALMAQPQMLMLDEPSTGLSPKLTWDVLNAAAAIRETGIGVLLVEQNAAQALSISDRAYVLESGSVVLEGPGRELAGDERVRKAYLGL